MSSKNTEIEASDFSVIGIGTSAGGLEALQSFFDSVPDGFHHTFVIVQHLSPDYKSLMAELLAKHTTMPIEEVTDSMTVEGGRIYLIPPGKNMTLQQSELRLTDKPTGRVLNLPINIFFQSLAMEKQEEAIGIVLSGTGTDGTIGLRAIKGAGGMTMAQNPRSAAFDGMPNSAISTGLIDYVLAPQDMPNELVHFLGTNRSETLGNTPGTDDPATFNAILKELQTHTELDFTQYKQPTLLRRLQRRLVVTSCKHHPGLPSVSKSNTTGSIHSLSRISDRRYPVLPRF